MDGDFVQSLDVWSDYFTLMGSAAATLLGLLFVAVSLRLSIFRQREVADVRDFAAFTFGTFLAGIAIAGLALAPHEERGSLALALLVMGLVGLLAVAWVASDWLALNRAGQSDAAGYGPSAIVISTVFVVMCGACLGLIVVALLLWRAHPAALVGLAVVEAGVLALGTIFAWILLAHARADE